MSNTSIQLKKSGQTGNTPPSLAYGEVALNYADGRLYYKTASNVISYITNQYSFSTINVGGNLILATTGSDTLTLQAGNNIGFITDSLNNKITITGTAVSLDQFARDWANSAGSYANAAFAAANSSSSSSSSGGSYANAAFIQANAAYAKANAGGGAASYIYNGTSNVYFASANGSILANVAGNTILTITANGFTTSGTSGDLSGANNIYANSFIGANGAVIAGVNVVPFITAAFLQANTPSYTANSAATYANAAFIQANTDVTNVSVTAGQYGSTTIIPVITIAANGRITAVSNATVSGGGGGSSSYIYNGTSNVYFSGANGNILANVAGNTIEIGRAHV